MLADEVVTVSKVLLCARSPREQNKDGALFDQSPHTRNFKNTIRQRRQPEEVKLQSAVPRAQQCLHSSSNNHYVTTHSNSTGLGQWRKALIQATTYRPVLGT